jgi:hypothetical protein
MASIFPCLKASVRLLNHGIGEHREGAALHSLNRNNLGNRYVAYSDEIEQECQTSTFALLAYGAPTSFHQHRFDHH